MHASIAAVGAPAAAHAIEARAVVEATALTRRYGDGDTCVDALRGVSLESRAAGSRPSWARRARASPRSCTSSPASTGRPSGTVEIDGVEIGRLNDTQLTKLRRTHVGFVFQFFNLLPMLTAEENVAPAAVARRPTSPSAAWLDELLATVGPRATGARTARPSSPAASSSASRSRGRSSRGRRCSSPTSRPATSTRARAPRSSTLLREAVDAYGQTTVMVTHDAAAAAIADRILFLADGLDRQGARPLRAAPRSWRRWGRCRAHEARRAQGARRAQAALAADRARHRPRRRDGQRHVHPHRHDPEGLRRDHAGLVREHGRGRSRGKIAFSTDEGDSGARRRSRRACSTRVEQLPAVAAASGTIADEAALVGRDGKTIGSGTSRRGSAFGVDATGGPRFNPLGWRRDAGPPAATQIAIDRRHRAARTASVSAT